MSSVNHRILNTGDMPSCLSKCLSWTKLESFPITLHNLIFNRSGVNWNRSIPHAALAGIPTAKAGAVDMVSPETFPIVSFDNQNIVHGYSS